MAHSQTQTKQILDLKVDSFKTGLEEVGNSFWVDDNQFLMTTLQEGAQRSVDKEEAPSRIALINFKTKKIKYIAEGARLLDFTFDHRTRSIFIGQVRTSDPVDDKGRRTYAYEYRNLQEIRIEPDGRVAEINKFPSGSMPPRPMANMPAGGGQPLDGGRGGFLIRDLVPGDTYMKQRERLAQNDEGWPTTWVRSGSPALSLSVRFDEIGSGEYLAFLDKYLLNSYDTAVTSMTSSHLNAAWKRPYEYTPFRLLGPDGSLQEIPYPQFVFEYGIAVRGSRGANFGRFLVTRDGIVIQKEHEHSSALYFFKKEKLFRVAGRPIRSEVNSSENSAEGIQTISVSPDGCKLAYSHLNGFAATSKFQTSRFFSILNLCAEK